MSPLSSQPTNDPNLARSAERHACDVPARFGPEPSTQAQLEFAESSEVSGTIVDYSTGGLGVRLPRFLPLGAEVWARVARLGGGDVACQGRVQRSTMIDRVPSYYVGLSFIGDSGPVLDVIRSSVRG